MAEKGVRIKADMTRSGWEDSDFPILCETCLGDNPYVRMTKEKFGGACHVCERPSTKFRWKAGSAGRFKNTVICQMCSKLRNVCQCCMLDLTYGVPTEVRDAIIAKYQPHMVASNQTTAITDTNRSYALMAAEKKQAAEGGIVPYSGLAALVPAAHEELLGLGKHKPHYERNAPKICTFFARGECTRGIECPYRHELPASSDKPFSRQNYKDRYYGVDDPSARKMLGKAGARVESEGEGLWDELMARDPTAVSIWVGNVPPGCGITDADVRAVFSAYGEVKSVFVSVKASSAFVEMGDHESAVAAVRSVGSKLELKGQTLRVSWARPRNGLDTRGMVSAKAAESAAEASATDAPAHTHTGGSGAPSGAPGLMGSSSVPTPAAGTMESQWAAMAAYQANWMAAMMASQSAMMGMAPNVVGAPAPARPGAGGAGPVRGGGRAATAAARDAQYPSMNPFQFGAAPKS